MTAHWLVTGSRGQLGSALVGRLSAAGMSFTACAHAELDIADADAVERCLASRPRPLVVVNAAAFTKVDRCEREPDAARRANAEGPAVLAAVCARHGAGLVHVSTDYVFAGDLDRPYREDDVPRPRSVYGRTKLEGEQAVLERLPGALVVRTSWVFGAGRNFIAAVLDQASRLRRGERREPLRVVDDQHGSPTWAVDLADAVVRLAAADAAGLLHLANAGATTWWGLARLCLDAAGFAEVEIERIATRDLSLPAPRPARSVLDTSRARELGVALRPWEEATRAYLGSAESPLRSSVLEVCHA